MHDILVGKGPSNLEYYAKNDILYVLNNISHSLSVINGTSDKVINVIPLAVEITPVSITVDPDSGLVYVGSDDIYGSIRIIRPVENLNYLQTGRSPRYLGLNAVTNKLYVSNYDTGNISVINENTGTLLNEIEIFKPPSSTNKIIVNDKTNKIYVANSFPNTVSIIYGYNNTISKNINFTKQPISIAVNTLTNKIYVASIGSPYIDIINGRNPSLRRWLYSLSSASSNRALGRARLTSNISPMPADGPFVIITMRSDSSTDSSTSCVTITAVQPDLAIIFMSSSCRLARVSASNAPKGSSNNSTFGSIDKARAMPTRCFIPPDISFGRLSAACVKPTSSSAAYVRVAS